MPTPYLLLSLQDFWRTRITFSRRPSWLIPSKGGLHSYYPVVFVFLLFFLPCLFPSEHFQNMNGSLFIYLYIFCFFLLSLNTIPSLHSIVGPCLSTIFVAQYGTSGRFLNTHHPSSSSNGPIAVPPCLHCTISCPYQAYGVELLSPCYQWRNSFRGLDDLLKATQPLRSDGDRIWAHVCLVLKPSLFLPCSKPQSLALRGAGRNVEKARLTLLLLFFFHLTNFKYQPSDTFMDKCSLAHHPLTWEATVSHAIGILLRCVVQGN